MGDVLEWDDDMESGKVVEFEESLTSIGGVWDLPMIGGEALDVLHQLQWHIGGPEVTLTCLEGALVGSLDGELYQLMESFDDNEYQPGSRAELAKRAYPDFCVRAHTNISERHACYSDGRLAHDAALPAQAGSLNAQAASDRTCRRAPALWQSAAAHLAQTRRF
jgi:hypothetical protein